MAMTTGCSPPRFLALSLTLLIQLSAVQARAGISLQGEHQEDHFSFSVEDNHEFRCFESTQELRDAVNRYEGYNHIDADLMETYGWPIGNWCVSQITDFSNLFFRKTKFNEPLNGWDMSSAVSTSGMFMDCFEFNQPLDQWDMSSIRDMSRMFAQTKKFNQPLDMWNVQNVQDASYAFMHSLEFDQDISSWNLDHIHHLEGTFEDARSLHERKLRGYDSHLENVKKSRYDENANDNNRTFSDNLHYTEGKHTTATLLSPVLTSNCKLRGSSAATSM